MMYMKVMFRSWKKRGITRTELIELPGIRGTDLTDEQTTSCEKKAKSLCHKGERVSGWEILEEYEANKLKERWAELNEPWYNSKLFIWNNKDEEDKKNGRY